MTPWVRSLRRHVGRGYKGCPAEVNGVKIGPQHNNWSCGPVALRHCLLSRGLDISAKKLIGWACSTRAGTGDKQLVRAARRAGCQLVPHVRRSPATIRRLVTSRLQRGAPLILCTERWSHWVAALHCGRRGFLVLDSSRPGPVIRLLTWRQLERKLRLSYSPKVRSAFKNDRRPNYFVMELSRPVHRVGR